MAKQILVALRLTLVLLLLVSGVYPLLVWGVGQTAFRSRADGSLVTDASGRVVGSALLAQGFVKPGYFHPRPSAAGAGYDPTASGGTNLGPTSDKLIHGAKGFDGVQQLARAYQVENGLAANAPVPVDAVTRSASGLDPDISVANAGLQADRIARARGLTRAQVIAVLREATEGRSLGVFGEPGVNVLKANLALDRRTANPVH